MAWGAAHLKVDNDGSASLQRPGHPVAVLTLHLCFSISAERPAACQLNHAQPHLWWKIRHLTHRETPALRVLNLGGVASITVQDLNPVPQTHSLHFSVS